MGMRSAQELRRQLAAIDGRGYPAYKGLRGAYDFGDYTLSVDHVQGDPFAAPSSVSVLLTHRQAGFPDELFDEPHRRVAFEDFLVRRFARQAARFSFRTQGSGKSGLIATSRPGPEVLERSACACDGRGLALRFSVGFPARGRTIDSDELARVLCDFVPRCVDGALRCDREALRAARKVAELADDQLFVREELARRGLVCFVADGAVLPRASGVSSAPLQGALPFRSPDPLRVTLDLPHRGPTSGMGVRRGVTLVVGGGYHGKSTLLRAIEAGVYDHVAGDGRELVITDASAVKLRAEDGRRVCDVDISAFIDGLPDGRDTRRFSTQDASGSTSQAAAAVEAVEAGARTLLIDEDTSATNFMVRDELMARVVSAEREPITPFVARVRKLYEDAGVSSVIVAGSSGAFFPVADTVVQMDAYEAYDITQRVRATLRECGIALAPGVRGACVGAGADVAPIGDERVTNCSASGGAPFFGWPPRERRLGVGAADDAFAPARGDAAEAGEPVDACSGATRARGRGPRGGHGGRPDRVKVRAGRDVLQVGEGSADLRLVEQLVDSEQTAALAQMVRFAVERGWLADLPVHVLAGRLLDEVARGGLAALCPHEPACGLAMPRPQELCACLNRWRPRSR